MAGVCGRMYTQVSGVHVCVSKNYRLVKDTWFGTGSGNPVSPLVASLFGDWTTSGGRSIPLSVSRLLTNFVFYILCPFSCDLSLFRHLPHPRDYPTSPRRKNLPLEGLTHFNIPSEPPPLPKPVRPRTSYSRGLPSLSSTFPGPSSHGHTTPRPSSVAPTSSQPLPSRTRVYMCTCVHKQVIKLQMDRDGPRSETHRHGGWGWDGLCLRTLPHRVDFVLGPKEFVHDPPIPWSLVRGPHPSCQSRVTPILPTTTEAPRHRPVPSVTFRKPSGR